MQSNLSALFAGRHEAVVEAPRRGPGRPPKKREALEALEAPEEDDTALGAVRQQLSNRAAFVPESPHEGKQKRCRVGGEAMKGIEEALKGVEGASNLMRVPGKMGQRLARGPQLKLQLIHWLNSTYEALGSTSEAWQQVLNAAAETWDMWVPEVVKVYEARATWEAQCAERGVSSHGLRRDEAQLPQYLRKSRRCNGVAMRKKGAGPKDKLEFLYPLVKDFFETMRLCGKYVDAVDLEDNLKAVMRRYIEEADKPGVEEAMTPEHRTRVAHVRRELERLSDPKSSLRVRDHRQQQLMRFCEARVRRPQRLTQLTLAEERGRWQTTLMSYDRLLWEAMRPELLKERIVQPEAFVAGIEDLVVCHCDQVPVWLRIGGMRQLFTASELRRIKAHALAVPIGHEPGGQVRSTHSDDGMAQMRQNANAEADRFRVTFEMSQLVFNVFKPSEAPLVRHGRPVLVVPGTHARLSNIDAQGCFIEDETFEVKGKQRVRKKGTNAGKLMESWRKLRDGDDESAKAWLSSVELMQQPAAFCDSVIVCWIAEMRRKEEANRMIVVRDMFAGGLSASCVRMSAVCDQLRTYIAGKMTAVMQLTDTACAFSLKKEIEAVKQEVRREKRGDVASYAAAFEQKGKEEMRCTARDLLKIIAEAMANLRKADEEETPDRLLKQARSAGWLSYRADPLRKVLVRCDEESWMQGKEDEYPEASHRHPKAWWAERYTWLQENGEPMQPDYKRCGKHVRGLECMKDEFPESAPGEEVTLHCLGVSGKKRVRLHDVDLSAADEEITFKQDDLGEALHPEIFLKTQRELIADLKRTAAAEARKPKPAWRQKVSTVVAKKKLRMKVKSKIRKHKRKAELREFLGEARERAHEGYSVRQLMQSHIPEIGGEINVKESEITEAMSKEATIVASLM